MKVPVICSLVVVTFILDYFLMFILKVRILEFVFYYAKTRIQKLERWTTAHYWEENVCQCVRRMINFFLILTFLNTVTTETITHINSHLQNGISMVHNNRNHTLLCASLFNLLHKTPKTLPPGPVSIPFVTSFQWLRKPREALEPTLRSLKEKYGPIITLSIGHQKSIFITNSSLAHQALIQHGAIFGDRPPASETTKIASSNQHTISDASYGPLWRLLRKNLMLQIHHPSKIKSFSPARKWVLNIIKSSIKKESNSGKNPVLVVDHLQFGMFCLLVFMCFGEKLDDEKIRQVEYVQRNFLLGFTTSEILNFIPKLGKIIFKKKWGDFSKLRSDQEEVLIPLIRSRQEQMKTSTGEIHDEKSSLGFCYVDSLLNLELPDEGGRKLTESEIVSLCSEFFDAGTDTTSTALQWILANLVKYQDIQSKLYDEIRKISHDCDDDEIQEEDLKKLPYLKAVILEGLRRHPPGHFVLNHAVTQDVGLDGYVVPKEAMVNFMVAEIGRDPKIWGEDSMIFKPERFLNEDDGSLNEEMSDVTGNKAIKMIPFGAGRRMCPASGLAVLHLECFVANLIKEFKWTSKAGDDIDLTEKREFTTVMKNPLLAHISPKATRLAFITKYTHRTHCTEVRCCISGGNIR